MKAKETVWTIPNILSIYRLLAFPLLAFLIVVHQERIFAIFFLLSLISDILDGWIARTFNLQTELGAKLDSWADTVTYIAGFWAIYSFKLPEILPHIFGLLTFLAAWLALYVAMFLKFKSVVGLHTYAFKITAYLQGACMMALLWFGFWPWFYYLSITWGILACIEEIIIVLLLPEAKTDVKGLFWVMKSLNP
jgi:cardiolipin synthase